ncbi:tetratricopeptide repeat protein [Lewinella sp. W8]|uniref:tetratricopeptide repeat protein n=1 Tax=Lewinella sp. W8 TaxID=2528208 RepID=UPI001068BA2F|nr:tetratricopeptide repeat protein [Lewinella sp. W8]MTB49847.1 tetratricopeptide repeat protein [Lewinella sp. W8]
MQRIEKTVFISYRRTNTPWALAIFQHLTSQGYDVFFDYNSIKSGDFSQIITQNIEGRAHFVVILTPSALERCSEPGDWLRREIELAIKTRRNIIPLFLEGFSFGTPSIARHLTGDLAPLKKYNGLKVPAEYFDAAMQKLCDERLNVALETVLHPITKSVQKKVREQQLAAIEAPDIEDNALTAQEWYEKAVNAKTPEDKEYAYDQAIQLRPAYPEAYNNRGNIKYGRKDFVGAIKDYNEAIRLDPDYALAYNNRGTARKGQGDATGAMMDYEEAIRLEQNHPDFYINRGLMRSRQGDQVAAIADYDRAIQLSVGRVKTYAPRAYISRGSARYRKGDLEGAILDYTEAIKRRKNYTLAYKNRGTARKNTGDILGALTDYQKYLDLGGGQKNGDQVKIEKTIQDLKDQYK